MTWWVSHHREVVLVVFWGGNHRMWPDWENRVIPHATNPRSNSRTLQLELKSPKYEREAICNM